MSRLAARYWSEGAAGPVLRALMAANAENAHWTDLASCTEMDPEAWFPETKGGSTAPAKQVCMACPVRLQCLEYALDNRIPHGVFGGKSERQRRAILRERERQAAA